MTEIVILEITVLLLFVWLNAHRIKCKLGLHTIPTGYAGGQPYFEAAFMAVDGMGVEHAYIMYRCAHCNESIWLGNIHLPKRMAEEHGEETIKCLTEQLEGKHKNV
jgi:hypothetical protein